MSRIDAQAQLAALIRTQAASLREPNSPSSRVERPGTSARKAALAEAPGRQIQNEQALRAKLQRIRADDPKRHARAFRLFLESTLVNEFGPGLAADESFGQIVDSVLSRMQEDEALHQASVAAAEILLANAHAGSLAPSAKG